MRVFARVKELVRIFHLSPYSAPSLCVLMLMRVVSVVSPLVPLSSLYKQGRGQTREGRQLIGRADHSACPAVVAIDDSWGVTFL